MFGLFARKKEETYRDLGLRFRASLIQKGWAGMDLVLRVDNTQADINDVLLQLDAFGKVVMAVKKVNAEKGTDRVDEGVYEIVRIMASHGWTVWDLGEDSFSFSDWGKASLTVARIKEIMCECVADDDPNIEARNVKTARKAHADIACAIRAAM